MDLFLWQWGRQVFPVWAVDKRHLASGVAPQTEEV